MKLICNCFAASSWRIALLLFLCVVPPALAEAPDQVTTTDTQDESTQLNASQNQDLLIPIAEAEWWALRVENLVKAIDAR